MATQTRVPTGTGATSEYAALGGGTKWSEVDDPVGTPDDATTYIYNSVANNREEWFTFAAFAIPDGSTINGVTVRMRGQRTAAGTLSHQVGIRVGAAQFMSGNLAAQTTWTDHSNTWATNPATTLAWTEAEVEALVTFLIKTVQFSAGEELQVTQVYIECDYTEPAGANPKGPLSNPFMGPFGGPI